MSPILNYFNFGTLFAFSFCEDSNKAGLSAANAAELPVEVMSTGNTLYSTFITVWPYLCLTVIVAGAWFYISSHHMGGGGDYPDYPSEYSSNGSEGGDYPDYLSEYSSNGSETDPVIRDLLSVTIRVTRDVDPITPVLDTIIDVVSK